MSRQPSEDVPQYLRYKPGFERSKDEGNRPDSRTNAPHMRILASLHDANTSLHRQIFRSRANNLCANCSKMVPFDHTAQLDTDAMMGRYGFELLPRYVDEAGPFMRNTTYPWYLSTKNANSCKLCHILQRYASELGRGEHHVQGHDTQKTSSPVKIRGYFHPTQNVLRIELQRDVQKIRLFMYAATRWPSPEDYRDDRLVRDIPTRSIDFGKISRWVHDCDEAHNHPPMKSRWSFKWFGLPESFRLIDVAAQKVTRAVRAPRYAALSYVWGSCEQYVLSRNDLQALEQDGALEKLTLARVVRDAMVVCRRLSIPYLWVDSICICQDDPQSKHNQLAMMDVIYSAAHVTLVDGRGIDANDVGLARVSTPALRTNDDIIIDHVKYVILEDPISAVERSQWRSRGWTLQETMLSKRLLVFLETDCLLICSSGVQADSFHDQNHFPISLQFYKMDIADLGGSIAKWYNETRKDTKDFRSAQKAYHEGVLTALNDYLPRNLSFEQDIENAFLGIECTFEQSLGVFHHGLPTKLFARALMWTSRDYLHLTNSERDHFRLERRPGFPSWSWSGWSFGKFWGRATIGNDVGLVLHWCPLIYIWGFNDSMDMIQLSNDYNEAEGAEGYTELLDGFASLVYRIRPVPDDRYPPTLPTLDHGAALSQHDIIFWASCAVFEISHEPKYPLNRQGFGTYVIRFSTNKAGHENLIVLKGDFRLGMHGGLEFVAVATCLNGDLDCIAIQWLRGKAYRIGVPYSRIPVRQWIDAKPTRKLVVMG
ncbi:hypothetical protein HBI25_122700 [Parastagonospora nodorum]|nr:hypothetical protein HBH52_099020 [Parastagonospora nodorum]KAH4172535.1 hypothetical protein HBH43_091210 [Parastagonospora nodorum]KAH4851950.1 hypothetical protein HBH75_119120 [Parastagonospora nodorum]KAH4989261.1 hypothetical protein HBI76_074730 [Parastagonospora nodorum]KAH5512179.1 hypothetical protein HBI29_105790 [Parastagonospora nodorum]